MLILYKIGFTLGAISLLVLLSGWLGQLIPLYLLLILVPALAGLAWSLGPQAKSIKPSHIKQWHFIPLAVFALIMLPLVLLPPTARDELIMHLAIPKLYLQGERIHELPLMAFSYYPLNIDLLYLIPLAFGNDVLPKLMHFGFALLTGGIIYFYLSGKLGKGYGLLGFFLYVSTPLVMQLSTTAYIDLGFAFYSTLALIAIVKWNERLELKWLVLSAIATGFALGSKYSAFILLAVFSLTITWSTSRATKDQFKALRLGILYFLIALAVFSPWLIRNYLWTHNPIYPLMNSFFSVNASAAGSLNAGLQVSSLPPLKMRSLNYGEELWYILLIPFRIFWEGKDGSPRFFDGLLNPLFLLFMPFAFIGKKNRDIAYLALFSLVFFFVAFFTMDMLTRYVLPVLPAVVIFTVYGFKNLFDRKQLSSYAVTALALLFMINGWYLTTLYSRCRPMAYLEGRETKEQYLSRRLPDYAAIAFANAALPANAKVMSFFAGDRRYYWERNIVSGERTGGDLIGFVREAGNEKDLSRRFKALGITHLFINDPLLMKFSRDNFDETQLAMLEGLFRSYAVKLYEKNGYSLYRL